MHHPFETGHARAELASRYAGVRATTEHLCAPLEIEDYVIQAMPDVSPPKWHLAHTTWFFETFVLEPFGSKGCAYTPSHPSYRVLFNSYYESVGQQHARPERGVLSRPPLSEVRAYRQRIDGYVLELLAAADSGDWDEIANRVVLGLNHEQQHQELLLMDTKYNFSRNPLAPAYRAQTDDRDRDSSAVHPRPDSSPAPMTWIGFEGGVHQFGYAGQGFCYDNEKPVHRGLVAPFRIASRLVTNGEYLEFIEDGGYDEPGYWLSDGWATVQAERWRAPLYWHERDGAWFEFTLGGMNPLACTQPVVHVSYYEADAYTRWRGKRLPTEYEWELLARELPVQGNLAESGFFHPRPASPIGDAASGRDAYRATQVFGDVWEWTQSPYSRYPGYQPLAGALGEYNGKFMCNQFVLRGGSCLTPQSHLRATYRNFYYPHQRWNTQGLRLAEDVASD
ncbi:MAG: ergothioneine biosynthesis protein EgtB [Proteobacteria bacterium]|nr:ergothioneine biosynthesis protein EgtB [Pseudomonadota bacterium]